MTDRLVGALRKGSAVPVANPAAATIASEMPTPVEPHREQQALAYVGGACARCLLRRQPALRGSEVIHLGQQRPGRSAG